MSAYDVAITLLDKDIQVIPLNKFKKPSISFKDVTIDREFINQHKRYYLKTSVLGVLTRGVWCIDIDINHKDGENGFDSLKAIPFYDEIERNINNTLVQTTASGGKHIIFKKRDGINYSQKINYLPSVDIKAHDNNYFVLAGSVTDKGTYTSNGNKAIEYNGEFENRVFSKAGSYEQQTLDRFKISNLLPNYDTSHLKRIGKGGLGKQAYQRIIDRQSSTRNDDLFKAVSYALSCSVDIEPLRVLIGDNKNGDVFTENMWEATVQSAKNNYL